MMKSIETILVAVDGSKGSHRAVVLAGDLAQRLGVSLRLLYVFPDTAVDLYGLPGEGMPPEQFKYLNPEVFKEVRTASARKVFDDARAELDPSQLSLVEEVLLSGSPRDAILGYAEQCNRPMILVGRRGLSALGELVMGSVSHYLLHHAHCPVTVVQ